MHVLGYLPPMCDPRDGHWLLDGPPSFAYDITQVLATFPFYGVVSVPGVFLRKAIVKCWECCEN